MSLVLDIGWTRVTSREHLNCVIGGQHEIGLVPHDDTSPDTIVERKVFSTHKVGDVSHVEIVGTDHVKEPCLAAIGRTTHEQTVPFGLTPFTHIVELDEKLSNCNFTPVLMGKQHTYRVHTVFKRHIMRRVTRVPNGVGGPSDKAPYLVDVEELEFSGHRRHSTFVVIICFIEESKIGILNPLTKFTS